ncbi:cytochrome P450 [Boeremia exigua]|uniref:cytochrome P450 n=1 Tax=Boeremia exigua TaxID=749465 RepID=UPI001E8E2187|nr:cytochrome P450 [Boeremia exigua]KAH6625117.1 cytochrome P450 [Boeremia exigua]
MFQILPIAAFSVLLLCSIANCLQVGRRPKGYPPGPPTIPILGNLHLLPKDRPYLQFTKWAREYGPIYSLILGTRTYIILSSPEVVKDLLDKRSNIYSSRPDMYVGQDIASGGLRIVAMKYGALWRKLHKMIHNILNIRAAVAYVPYQDLENKQMLFDLLNTPNDFEGHLRRYSNSLTTQMVFGFRTTDNNDPKLKQLFDGFQKWGELIQIPSAQLLDLFPILRRLPASLRPNFQHAQQLHKDEMGLYLGHWMKAKRGLQSGSRIPCFCNDVLRVQKQEEISDEQAAYLSGSLLEAGSDTTSSILIGLVQALLVHPSVQKTAQEEIDRIVGPHRLPTMEDSPTLPYIRAIVKESIRWMPTAVLAIPHSTTQTDSYRGYTIPAGATVLCNVWALHMDPERNPDPRVFNPGRFANDARTEFESATGEPTTRNNYIFGAGRRLCQGMHIAERSLFLAAARLLWAFEFQRVVDCQTGMLKPLPDVDELVGGLTVQPAPFEVGIVPRSEDRAVLIREAWREQEESMLDGVTKQWRKVPEGMAFST